MGNLQVFNNEMFGEIRMVEVNGIPYAVAKDIALALEYSNTNDAIIKHCRGVATCEVSDRLGRPQKTKVIPEGDIYRLIIKAADQSKNPAIKEKAEKFERWIFDEVLPSIRKHGAYMTPDVIERTLTSPDFIIKLAQNLKDEQEKVKQLTQVITEVEPKISYMESYVESDGLYGVREAAKILGIGERLFVNTLLSLKILYRKGGFLLPYAKHQHKRYFNVKTGVDNEGGIYCQTKFTTTGMLWIARMLSNEGIIKFKTGILSNILKEIPA